MQARSKFQEFHDRKSLFYNVFLNILSFADYRVTSKVTHIPAKTASGTFSLMLDISFYVVWAVFWHDPGADGFTLPPKNWGEMASDEVFTAKIFILLCVFAHSGAGGYRNPPKTGEWPPVRFSLQNLIIFMPCQFGSTGGTLAEANKGKKWPLL